MRLASAAARAFSTTSEVRSIFRVLFIAFVPFLVLFKVSISGAEAKWPGFAFDSTECL